MNTKDKGHRILSEKPKDGPSDLKRYDKKIRVRPEMKSLDVSVIIPCYNSIETLERCLISVAGQTALPRDVIIIDDGSEEMVSDFVSKWDVFDWMNIRIIRQPNRGAPAARNAGLKIADGKYVAFLDSDDIWLPDKLRIQFDIMQEYDFVISGHGYEFDCTHVCLEDVGAGAGHRKVKTLTKSDFMFSNPFFTPTVMVEKRLFLGFDERFLRADDYKAWVEAFLPGRCVYIAETLAAGYKPPIGHSGLTSSIIEMHKAYVSVLGALRSELTISVGFYLCALLVEYFKLPVRWARIQIRKN